LNYQSLHVAVIDIGKLTNLGWAIEGPIISSSGTDIDECIEALAQAIEVGPLALGFEAPMFVPFGRDREELDHCRVGEGDRAFSASAGACSLVKGLVIAPYILGGLRSRIETANPTFKWHKQMVPGDLLLFEAFVTHVGPLGHKECARLAVEKFISGMENQAELESAINEPRSMNLLGAMLLRIGWTEDLSILSEPCLVVRYIGDH
jgi:hypothetical protein